MNENDSQPDDEVIGANLRRLRMERQLSQAALANRAAEAGLPFHQQTIDKVENGRRPLRLAEAAALAQVLGADLAELLASPDESQLVVDLREALEMVRSLRTAAVEGTLLYLRAHRAAAKVLDHAVAVGHGPMDNMDLAASGQSFREAWQSGRAPERIATDLAKALAWEVDQLPAVARRLDELEVEAESTRRRRGPDWRILKQREVSADTPPWGD